MGGGIRFLLRIRLINRFSVATIEATFITSLLCRMSVLCCLKNQTYIIMRKNFFSNPQVKESPTALMLGVILTFSFVGWFSITSLNKKTSAIDTLWPVVTLVSEETKEQEDRSFSDLLEVISSGEKNSSEITAEAEAEEIFQQTTGEKFERRGLEKSPVHYPAITAKGSSEVVKTSSSSKSPKSSQPKSEKITDLFSLEADKDFAQYATEKNGLQKEDNKTAADKKNAASQKTRKPKDFSPSERARIFDSKTPSGGSFHQQTLKQVPFTGDRFTGEGLSKKRIPYQLHIPKKTLKTRVGVLANKEEVKSREKKTAEVVSVDDFNTPLPVSPAEVVEPGFSETGIQEPFEIEASLPEALPPEATQTLEVISLQENKKSPVREPTFVVSENEVQPAVQELKAQEPIVQASSSDTESGLLAFRLGGKLSIVVLAKDQGTDAERVASWLKQSQALAKYLQVAVPPIPASIGNPPATMISDEAFDFIVGPIRKIGWQLSKNHGKEHAAIFEVAIKSNLALVIYTPKSEDNNVLERSIRTAAHKAGLPKDLVKPLLDVIIARRPTHEIQSAVYTFHRQVDAYLSK